MKRAFLVLHLAVLMNSALGATDRTWSGSSGPFWTTAANWSGVAPVAGDNLIFPSGILNMFATNNYAAGTAFGRITLSQGDLSGYILGGNRITLNGGLSSSGTRLSYAPLLAMDITLGADQAFISTRGVTLSGRVDLNGHFLFVGPASTGNLLFNGVATNSSVNGGGLIKTNTGAMIIGSSASFQVPRYIYTDQFNNTYYTPSINVLNGNLRIDGVATNANLDNPVEIVVQGPGMLTGTGTAGSVTVRNGGILNPGLNGPGKIYCRNAYPEDTSGILQMEINSTTPVTGYDQVVTEAYPGWNGVLDLRFGYSPLVGDTFYLMIPAYPIGNSFTPSGILDHTNGCSFGLATSSAGFSVTTLRTPASTFSLWKGSVGGSFPAFYFSTLFSPTNNWAMGVAPTNGGRLVFTEYGLNIAPLTNDLPSSYSLASLTFSGANAAGHPYTIYGNALAVTEGITNWTGGGTNTLMVDLVASGQIVFDVDAASTTIFGKGFNGGGTIRKHGAGNLVYNGITQNAFVGDLAVENGMLRLDGSFLDGGVTVSGGTLSGTGHVAGVTLNGGVLNPGPGPGIFYVEGNFAANAGSTCRFEINSAVAGTGYDQLRVNGSVTLNGATLDIVPNYSVTVGTVFLLVINDLSDPISGTFAGLPQGATFQAGGQWFMISYNSGAGNNDIVLTRVAAPSQPGNFSGVTVAGPNAVQLQGIGASNVTYTIQANTNLATANWLDIGTAPADGSGHFSFTDTNTSLYPQRFFRTKSP